MKIRSNRTGLFLLFSFISRLKGQLLNVAPGSLLYEYTLRGYHLFKTKNVVRFLSRHNFKVIKIVNEKQDLTPSMSLSYILKLARIAFSCCVNILTLGKIKIGTEITVYAVPT